MLRVRRGLIVTQNKRGAPQGAPLYFGAELVGEPATHLRNPRVHSLRLHTFSPKRLCFGRRPFGMSNPRLGDHLCETLLVTPEMSTLTTRALLIRVRRHTRHDDGENQKKTHRQKSPPHFRSSCFRSSCFRHASDFEHARCRFADFGELFLHSLSSLQRQVDGGL